MSRAYTEHETRSIFLDEVWNVINYWNNVERTDLGKMEGLAFSMLVMIDGGHCIFKGDDLIGLPSFRLMPICDQESREFHIEQGTNFYDPNIDIGGCLHEQFYDHKPDDGSNLLDIIYIL